MTYFVGVARMIKYSLPKRALMLMGAAILTLGCASVTHVNPSSMNFDQTSMEIVGQVRGEVTTGLFGDSVVHAIDKARVDIFADAVINLVIEEENPIFFFTWWPLSTVVRFTGTGIRFKVKGIPAQGIPARVIPSTPGETKAERRAQDGTLIIGPGH